MPVAPCQGKRGQVSRTCSRGRKNRWFVEE